MSNPQKFGQVIVLIRSLLMFVFLYVENPRPNFSQHVCYPLEIGCHLFLLVRQMHRFGSKC